VSKLYE
jgi:hypothetical protein